MLNSIGSCSVAICCCEREWLIRLDHSSGELGAGAGVRRGKGLGVLGYDDAWAVQNIGYS